MPQLDDGFTRIANELLEAYGLTRIPGEARQVLDVIIRKTYGWGKKKDIIALSQFCLATGLPKSSVIRGIKKLLAMNLVYQKVNASGTEYGINKDYSAWKPFTKKSTVTKTSTSVYENVKKPFTKKRHTKETTTKETITKDKGSRFTPPTVDEVAEYCKERKNNIDPQLFIDHYETTNWMRGNNKIKRWKACVRTWEKRDKSSPQASEVSDINKQEIKAIQGQINRAKSDMPYLSEPEQEKSRVTIARLEREIEGLGGKA